MSHTQHVQDSQYVAQATEGSNATVNVHTIHNQYFRETLNTLAQLVSTLPPLDGYITRTSIEATLRAQLEHPDNRYPVILYGISGVGKTWLATQVIHTLQTADQPAFPGGVLWESLNDLEPHHLLNYSLGALDTRSSLTNPLPPHMVQKYFWETVTRYTEQGAQQRTLIVFDDVQTDQQLHSLLPPPPHTQTPPHCSILIICTYMPRWSDKLPRSCGIQVSNFDENEALTLFKEYLSLDCSQMQLYETSITEITQRLSLLPLLLAAAARDMRSTNTSPGSYVRSLREQDNPGSTMSRAVVDGLELAIRDLSDQQQWLLAFTGVLGEGSWQSAMLAAIALRRPKDVQRDLDVLVTRGLVRRLDNGRYTINGIVREFARQRFKRQSPYTQDAAHTCLAHYCLDYAQHLAATLQERPHVRAQTRHALSQRDTAFIREYHKLMLPEMSHIARAIEHAQNREDWSLLLRFADISHAELVRYFVANSFEVALSLHLATIIEPTVWLQGTRQQAGVDHTDHLITMSGWHYPSTETEGIEPYGDPPHRIEQHQSPGTDRQHGCELHLTITGGQIIDGLFEQMCFFNNSWVGVRATGLICRDTEMIGCEMIACDLSQCVWLSCVARQLNLVGSNLSYALLRDVKLDRACLRDAQLVGTVLEHVTLRGADLRNATFNGALLDTVDLRNADLRGARFVRAHLRKVNLTGCRLDEVVWTDTYLDRCQIEDDIPSQDASDKHKQHPRLRSLADMEKMNNESSNNPSDDSKHVNLSGADLRALKPLHPTEEQQKKRYDTLAARQGQLQGVDLRAATLNTADFTEANLEGANLRAVHLINPMFKRANLRHVDIRGAVLENATFEGADLTNANLRQAILQQGALQQALLRGARLRGARLTQTHLERADLVEADLAYADLSNAHLNDADLRQANLQSATLTNAHLAGINLEGANCTETDFTRNGTDMVDRKQTRDILAALTQANEWRGATLPSGRRVRSFPKAYGVDDTSIAELRELLEMAYLEGSFKDLDWSRYNLFGGQLGGVFTQLTFRETKLDYARLTGRFDQCDFTQAQLPCARLSGVFSGNNQKEGKFTGANLSQTHLTGSFSCICFHNARLEGAHLKGIFSRCSFQHTDLSQIDIEGVNLISCDLSHATISEPQLRNVASLRGTIMPDGHRYDGWFDLPGDWYDACRLGYDLSVEDDKKRFYSSESLIVR